MGAIEAIRAARLKILEDIQFPFEKSNGCCFCTKHVSCPCSF